MIERIVLTRGDLFARVWSTPVFRLAQEFGISDVALSKLCRRRNVPVPPRGYWAKLAGGQAVSRPQLPPALPEHDKPAVFYRRLGPTSPRMIDEERGRLHPIADRLRKSLLLGKPSPCGRVHVEQGGLPHVVASPRQATKVAELVHTLISEAERSGIDIVRQSDGRPLEFCRGRQSARICIEEELRPRSPALVDDLPVPSGRLVLRLAMQWKQTEDLPVEELVTTLLTRMDGCLRS